MTSVSYTPIRGGLKTDADELTVDPGRVIAAQNFEVIAGEEGVRRTPGYAVFDGGVNDPRDFASLTSVWMMNVTGALTPSSFSPGQYVSWGAGDDHSGYVVKWEYVSASAGVLILDMNSGATVVAGTAVTVFGATIATTSGAGNPYLVSSPAGSPFYDSALAALQAYRLSSLFRQVPGVGTTHIAAFGGRLLARRNRPGNEASDLYEARSGWVRVRAGLAPNGSLNGITYNFGGSTPTVKFYCADGVGRPWSWDGTNVAFAPAIQASEGTSVSSVTIGTGAKVFTVVETARSWVPGDVLLIRSAADASRWMRGTVTTWAAPTLTMNIVATSGAGTFTDWYISRYDDIDKAIGITAHKNHLFLVYPKGQLQTSNLGDPFTFTSTASLFGLGDDITGLLTMKGDVLAVFQRNRINLLYGTGATNWVMKEFSPFSGAYGGICDINGNALYLDSGGLFSLTSTDAYGDFGAFALSKDIKNFPQIFAPVFPDGFMAAVISKTKGQYRLYKENGEVWPVALNRPSPMSAKDVQFMRLRYPVRILKAIASEDIYGNEQLHFVTDQGQVMQEDVGISFAGQDIEAWARLPHNHFRSPAQKKRFRKIEVNIAGDVAQSIAFRQEFDFNSGEFKQGQQHTGDVGSFAALWNDSNEWNAFNWSDESQRLMEASVDGVGRSQSLIFYSKGQTAPYTLRGYTTHFSPLGLKR